MNPLTQETVANTSSSLTRISSASANSLEEDSVGSLGIAQTSTRDTVTDGETGRNDSDQPISLHGSGSLMWPKFSWEGCADLGDGLTLHLVLFTKAAGLPPPLCKAMCGLMGPIDGKTLSFSMKVTHTNGSGGRTELEYSFAKVVIPFKELKSFPDFWHDAWVELLNSVGDAEARREQLCHWFDKLTEPPEGLEPPEESASFEGPEPDEGLEALDEQEPLDEGPEPLEDLLPKSLEKFRQALKDCLLNGGTRE